MSKHKLNRRKLTTILGTGVFAGLAGCIGDDVIDLDDADVTDITDDSEDADDADDADDTDDADDADDADDSDDTNDGDDVDDADDEDPNGDDDSPEDCLDCESDGSAARISWMELENQGDSAEIEVTQRRPSTEEETIFDPTEVGQNETFDFDVITTGPSELTFLVDGDSVAIDHADDNEGDTLHVSCSATVRTSRVLHRDEDELGNSLSIDEALDRDGYCISGE